MPGGLFIVSPNPQCVTPGTTWGKRLQSDPHIGASDVDYKLLKWEIQDAIARKDRLSVNGDVFDAILTRDFKRYEPTKLHKRLQGRNDILNAAIDMAYELYAPAAKQIDMIGVGNHDCHDEATEVLTETGWKFFKNVEQGEKLATFNKQTGVIEYQKPSTLVQYDYDGLMFCFAGRQLNFCVTPNHRMVYSTNYGCKKAKTWQTKEIQEIPTTITNLRFPCAGRSSKPEYPYSDDQIAIVAWLLTDGHLGEQVGFTQRDSKVKRITQLLDRLGASYGSKSRKRDTKQICGRTLIAEPEASTDIWLRRGPFLSWLRSAVPADKSLPTWVLDLSDRQFEIFLNSLVDGDGSRKKNVPALVLYGKKEFLSSVQAACVSHGYRASISWYTNHCGTHPRLNLSKGTIRSVVGYKEKLELKHYTGTVYCATVWNDTLVTRRHGKVLISGNSAVEKHHNFDAVKALVDRLNKLPGAQIAYGGYGGLLSYNFELLVDGKRKPVKPLNVMYWHGAGGGASLSASAAEFDRKAFVEHADVLWFGHKHTKMVIEVERLGFGPSGKLLRRRQWNVRTGAYFTTYRPQTQKHLQETGRQSNFAADALLPPQGRGGVRLVVEFDRKTAARSISVEMRSPPGGYF